MKQFSNLTVMQRKNTCGKLRLVVFYTLLLTCIPSNSIAQYRYDIGLKASSYDMERFQFETRFHFKSPYSLVVNYSHGSTTTSSRGSSSNPFDSTFSTSHLISNYYSNTIKFGVQRKFKSFASDVFYAGASLGIGHRVSLHRIYETVYMNDSLTQGLGFFGYYHPVASQESVYRYEYLDTQLSLSFGINAPLTKRIVINVELSLAGFLSRNINSNYHKWDIVPSISGGVRYSFGKWE